MPEELAQAKDWGRRIRAGMALRDLRQEDLAALVGVSQQAVSCWCRGVRPPPEELWDRLAEVLGVTVDRLFGGGDLLIECGT